MPVNILIVCDRDLRLKELITDALSGKVDNIVFATEDDVELVEGEVQGVSDKLIEKLDALAENEQEKKSRGRILITGCHMSCASVLAQLAASAQVPEFDPSLFKVDRPPKIKGKRKFNDRKMQGMQAKAKQVRSRRPGFQKP